jgi:hypothetical protein
MNAKIKKIYATFNHSGKVYSLFTIKNSNHSYLYYFNPKNKNRALLFGLDFVDKVNKLKKNPKKVCIECELGSQILGAISFDSGDFICSNISHEKANQIILQLKRRANLKDRELLTF